MNSLKKFILQLTVVFIISLIFIGCSPISEENTPVPSENTVNDLSIDDILKKEVDKNYSFDDPFVALDPYENAPLSALVIFNTPEETAVNIKVLGHDESSSIETKFEKSKKHIIPIYGLYANEENTVTMTLDDGSTKELKITTDIINAPYNEADVVTAENEMLGKDLTFVSYGMKSPGGIVAAAYDNNGKIRWALKGDAPAWEVIRLKNGRLLVSSEEKHSEPYYPTGFQEIDLMGKSYKEYVIPGGYHHSVVELPNENFLVAAQEEGGTTIEDLVYEISRDTGDIVKTFDLKDVLPIDDGSSLIEEEGDWFHNNSIWYDEKTNSVLLSGRTVNAVISIDYETGDLRWILGDPQGWTKVDSNYFFEPIGKDFEWQYAQHASMITPEGYVFLFDNGLFRAKKTNEETKLSGDENYSRGVIYKIDEKNMTIEQIWQYGRELSSDWYSFYLGDVDYLDKNHYLINSGGQLYDTLNKTREVTIGHITKPETQKTASIVEIKDDKVILEMKMDFNIFAAEKMSIYTQKNNYDLK